MRFASLGSGSSGNATLVCGGSTTLLVDCGFTIKETEKRLARLAVAPSEIDAILVTHEHSDHVKGVAPFARKHKLPVFMTEGTFGCRDYGKLPALELICHYQRFRVGDIDVQPVAVPHDAREPAQFVFQHGGLRLGVLTDLGSVTSHVLEAYADCDGLIVEANHDVQMLSEGPYPYSLKRRVASPWGHLNNQQTLAFLQDVSADQLQQLVIGHISRTNNSVECVQEALQMLQYSAQILYACQDEGFDWLELQKKCHEISEKNSASAVA